MRISTQYKVTLIIFTLVLTIIGASVAVTSEQVSATRTQESLANGVVQGASDLSYLSNDYVIYHGTQQLTQWQTRYNSFSVDVSQLKPDTSDQQALVNDIIANQQRMKTVFESIVESQSQNATVSGLETSWSRITIQSQTLISDGISLAQSLRNQVDSLNTLNNVLIGAVILTFAVFVIVISYQTFRRTLKSLSRLEAGTSAIGSGNLDFKVAEDKDDEIGHLAKVFNQMTANLKTVTASKTDLEQAQASLRESEQRWSTTLASIGDAVIATDTSGKITFMNGEAEELTGWTPSEVYQKPVKTAFNIVNEQTRLEVESPIERVLKEGMVVGLANHTVLIRKDGSEVPIDDSGAPIKDKEGKTTGVVLVFRDITERKKAEEQITRLASFPTLNPNPIIEMDLDGKIQYINPAAKTMFADLEALSLNHPFLVNWKSATKALDEKTTNTFACEVKIGDDWYLQIYSHVPNGQRIRVYALNITERKKSEEAVARQAELIDLSPDAIIVRTLDGTISFWSKGAEKLYGWTKEEAVGQVTHTLLKTQFPQSLDEIVKAVTLNGKWSGELVHICKNGDKVFVQSYWLGKFGSDGKIVEMLESNVDITQRVELQSKLEESAVRVEEYANQMEELAEKRAAQLKDAERLAAIGATAGMVGHDIRNPLQAITSDVFLAKSEIISFPDGEGKQNALESMDEIEKNIDYINKIVQDLQDYARPLNPKMEESDLKVIAESLIAKSNLPKNIAVKVKVADDARRIDADSYYLNRILYNLVTNAVQAMPQGGKLTIAAHKEAEDTVLSVVDSGVGISQNARDKMFTLMFTTKSKGQGFGLPVVKRMAEALGGSVTFESEEGKGTTFTVRLPPSTKK